jgi:hypothetical protein
VIPNVTRGAKTAGVLRYLVGKGKREEHEHPHPSEEGYDGRGCLSAHD